MFTFPALLESTCSIVDRVSTNSRLRGEGKPALRRDLFLTVVTSLVVCCLAVTNPCSAGQENRPNIVLVMADDLGYAQTGYYDHPLLATPNLDALAAGGLRLDRFYANGPVCSPTRASVLTGRAHCRTGVMEHGFALRHQEKCIAQAIAASGYATGHFGKWHLNGLRGPGAPIFRDDPFSPGKFGFTDWLSVTNFFDMDPLLSRRGEFEPFEGDSSEVVVDQMLQFAKAKADDDQPFFAVVWFGTPHSPFKSYQADIDSLADGSAEKAAILKKMDKNSLNQYGELVAMDRSLGALRSGLQSAGVLDDTLIWFNSDNGGLNKITPSTTAPLRGHKGQLYEGGIRVPCVLHWPGKIEAGRVSSYPACTTDIAPTLVDLLDLPADSLVTPVDGTSLVALMEQDFPKRQQPLGFRYKEGSAVIDNDWKLIRQPSLKKTKEPKFELYNVANDIGETKNVFEKRPDVAARLSAWLKDFNASTDASIAGQDYPEGKVNADHPASRHWHSVPQYQAIFDQLQDRWEYKDWIKKAAK